MIEGKLKGLLETALKKCKNESKLKLDLIPEIILETPRSVEHGDYATNLALMLAKSEGLKPRDVAQMITDHLPSESKGFLNKVEIAGPGFINFHIVPEAYFNLLNEIVDAGENFGSLDIGKGKKVQVEFVSANPTGPLHVGHGRGAVFGDALASVLKTAGYEVNKEYYLNDAGVQIQTLGKSLFLRMKQQWGDKVEFPQDCYQGEYLVDMAKELIANDGDKYRKMPDDELINICSRYSAKQILGEIIEDLKACGITHDTYFSETTLHTEKAIDKALALLKKNGKSYESEGALWFKSTDYGDEKDRVLRKGTGDYTYFAADIAYHEEKFRRGFDLVIDIWGADHAGHVPRMKSALAAMGFNPDALQVILIQLVNLIRAGELISMSTRSAQYETFRRLVDEVGKDVCRYFFLMRSHNAQLDFDLELALKDTPENPVYYIQYAHARIVSVFKKAAESGMNLDTKNVDLSHLGLPEEVHIAKFLFEFPKVIAECATTFEPHKLTYYLLELAKIFQSYYTCAKQDARYKMVTDDSIRTNTKLYLLKATQIVLKRGLEILGISVPEKMTREERDE